MELGDQGSLSDRIRSMDPQLQLRIFNKYDIALGIIQGLEYLHFNHVVHRDLKPENILLVGPNLTPKIADFGLSKVIDKTMATMKTEAGTVIYQAPETFDTDQQGYTSMADVYSASLILYELLSGQKPIECNGYHPGRVTRLKMQEHPPKPSPDIPVAVFVLISMGYSLVASERPSLLEFHSAFFNIIRYAYCNAGLQALGVQFRTGE
jgi:serine/threonine protein kinase